MKVTIATLAATLACAAPAAAFLGHSPIIAPKMTSSSSLMMRTPFIAGNWKENPASLTEAIELAKGVVDGSGSVEGVEVAMIPPTPFIYSVQKIISGSNLKVGAQNIFFEETGAYTGAVSTGMVKSVGAEYVLCGHSERRSKFRDDDLAINKKVRKVLDAGMIPILCVGEDKEEYEANLNTQICAVQLAKDLKGVTGEEMKKIVIAYEPVWAIGTGLTATPEIAQSVHAYIRSFLTSKFGSAVSNEVRIQYGGSVTPDTVDALMACPDIDGALVGGASLTAESFNRIINYKK